eukprot:3938357-Rhodomonas_salina.4
MAHSRAEDAETSRTSSTSASELATQNRNVCMSTALLNATLNDPAEDAMPFETSRKSPSNQRLSASHPALLNTSGAAERYNPAAQKHSPPVDAPAWARSPVSHACLPRAPPGQKWSTGQMTQPASLCNSFIPGQYDSAGQAVHEARSCTNPGPHRQVCDPYWMKLSCKGQTQPASPAAPADETSLAGQAEQTVPYSERAAISAGCSTRLYATTPEITPEYPSPKTMLADSSVGRPGATRLCKTPPTYMLHAPENATATSCSSPSARPTGSTTMCVTPPSSTLNNSPA